MTTTLIGTVSEVFAIRDHGVGVLFVVSPDHIAARDKLDIVVARPDGTVASFAAHREFARTLRSPTGEAVALSIRGATRRDITVGSVVTEAVPGAAVS